jgi:hypothetical protein
MLAGMTFQEGQEVEVKVYVNDGFGPARWIVATVIIEPGFGRDSYVVRFRGGTIAEINVDNVRVHEKGQPQ